MGTDAVVPGRAVECPVCGERFAETPAQCFRCETDLTAWWPLHGALVAMAAAVVPVTEDPTARVAPPAPLLRTRVGAPAVALVVGLMAGGLFPGRPGGTQPIPASPPRPERSVPPVRPATHPPEARLAAPSTTVRYVVQRGDSLWRIAAALKGDARRWPDLVAAAGSKTPTTTLRPGQELRIEVASTESEPGP